LKDARTERESLFGVQRPEEKGEESVLVCGFRDKEQDTATFDGGAMLI
jgi:hypothetical protein